MFLDDFLHDLVLHLMSNDIDDRAFSLPKARSLEKSFTAENHSFFADV